jgi:hypothetical protein
MVRTVVLLVILGATALAAGACSAGYPHGTPYQAQRPDWWGGASTCPAC